MEENDYDLTVKTEAAHQQWTGMGDEQGVARDDDGANSIHGI